MYVLDTTSKSLRIVLGGAVAANELPWTVAYEDIRTSLGELPQGSTGPLSIAGNDGATAGATAVTMAAAPSGAVVCRIIKSVSVQNADSAAATVTISLHDGSSDRPIAIITLPAGGHLFYEDGAGWRVLKDVNGQLRTVAT